MPTFEPQNGYTAEMVESGVDLPAADDSLRSFLLGLHRDFGIRVDRIDVRWGESGDITYTRVIAAPGA